VNIVDVLLSSWPKNLRSDGKFTCPSCGRATLAIDSDRAHCPGENREFTTGDLFNLLQHQRSTGKTPPKQKAPPEQPGQEPDNSKTQSQKFNHLVVAKKAIAAYGHGNIIHALGATWRWNGTGVWRKLDDRDIRRKIHEVADSHHLTRSVVDSCLDLFKTETFSADHQFDLDREAINCKNGELHWAGRAFELKPHTRENYSTTQIPVAYDPRAIAPRFTAFLAEIFADDEDSQEKTQIVLEAVGYSLLSSCRYEKFFLLIGAGANGKSVLMDTVGSLVGLENVCAVQPSQFENRFQRAHLHCKLVNLVTEIAEGHEIADAQLKAIVSGELTTAEHKHAKPFDFKPYATCWFGTNHRPHTRDFSDALFRRAIVLTFNRTFEEYEQDKHLKDKLRTELPGILNLSLRALGEVFLRGEFTTAPSCETAKQDWRMDCDQVAQFVDDCCIIGSGLLISSTMLYSRYEDWTREAGIRKSLNRKNFTMRLSRLGIEPCKGTAGARMLAGIDLKP
jgi:putative DNA primase/helicase